jgi:hypothetical protein
VAPCDPHEGSRARRTGRVVRTRVRSGAHVRATLGRAGVSGWNRRPLGCRDVETAGWTRTVSRPSGPLFGHHESSAKRSPSVEGGWVSASKTADRSLEEVRTKSVPVSDSPDEPPCGDPPDEQRERPAPIALAGVRGRAGFPANRRSVAAPWPLPHSLMPFHRFRSRLQGLPTDARSRVSVRTSASPPSRRVQRARLERDHLTLVARKRTSSTTRSCLPRTRSFLGPLLRRLQRSTPRAPEGTPSGRGCHTTASRSALVVSHHLGGFLRAAGPGLVASRYRTWGSLRFTCARRRVYEAPAAGVWAGPHPEGGVPTGSSQR